MAFKRTLIFVLIIISIYSCDIPLAHKIKLIDIKFNADSAYKFIKEQLAFGPRVPNTPAHDSCAIFLSQKLRSYNAKVALQNAIVYRYDSLPLRITNIIAQFYPYKKRRILLFTHWDTRFIADNEKDSVLRYKPFLGANDGASGVAVLLEIARHLSVDTPKVGVDIIFFDAEDQGEPQFLSIFNKESWSLGARYWVKHKHFCNYLYGIDIDMVGGKNAKFYKEDFSLFYYGYLLYRIWHIAKLLGYDSLFIDKNVKSIFDDHFVLNQNGIRSVLIIETHRNNKFYPSYWHTHGDNLQVIDKKTLKAVGQIILNVIYNQK